MEIDKIHNEDCQSTLSRMVLEGFRFDLFLGSPPYDSIRKYGGHEWNFDIFMAIAWGLAQTLKPGGVICWVIDDQIVDGSKTLTSFKQAIYFKETCGLNLHEEIIYQKNNFSHPQKARYHQTHEKVFVFSKVKPKTFNPIRDRKNITAGQVGNVGINSFTKTDGSKGVRPKKIVKEFGMRHSVWRGNTVGQEQMGKKLPHPAMMPAWLARDLILSYSNEGDIVYDGFAGSGTTLIEAKKLKRNYLGSEISEDYCKIAQARLESVHEPQNPISNLE